MNIFPVLSMCFSLYLCFIYLGANQHLRYSLVNRECSPLVVVSHGPARRCCAWWGHMKRYRRALKKLRIHKLVRLAMLVPTEAGCWPGLVLKQPRIHRLVCLVRLAQTEIHCLPGLPLQQLRSHRSVCLVSLVQTEAQAQPGLAMK